MKSVIGVSWVISSRVMAPSATTGSVQFAGGPVLGGGTDYVKPEAEAILYIPHTQTAEDMPFYHPAVAKLAFLHRWRHPGRTDLGHRPARADVAVV